MIVRCVLLICVLVLGLGLPGCSPKKSKAKKQANSLAPIDANANPANSDITNQEAMELAKNWESCVLNGKAVQGAKLLDYSAIMDRAMSSFEVTQKFKNDAKKGALQKQPSLQMIQQLIQSVEAGGDYKLLRVVRRGGVPHAIYRMNLPEGGINYHDFQIQRFASKIYFEDLFVAATGESVSETIRATLAPFVAAHKSTFSKLSGSEKKAAADIEAKGAFMNAVNQGSPNAMQLYNSLPASIKRDKVVQLLRIGLAGDNEQELLALIAKYRNDFPNDPSLALVTLDSAVLKKDDKMLIECVDSLTDWTGGDTFLTVLASNLLVQFGNSEASGKYFDKVNCKELDSSGTLDLALFAALKLKRFDDVLTCMEVLKDEHDIDLGNLTANPDFAEFVKSPQYQKWVNRGNK